MAGLLVFGAALALIAVVLFLRRGRNRTIVSEEGTAAQRIERAEKELERKRSSGK